MAMVFAPRLLKHQVGVHVEVVTNVNRILDFMEKPKDVSIADIVKTLQKTADIQQKLRDAVEDFGIDVIIIDDAIDANSTLEYLQNRQKSDEDILAYVRLYIGDDETKNTVWLNSDFPCPVVLDFCKTEAVHVTNHSAIEKACDEEFGLGTAAVRKRIAKLKDEFDDYSSNLRKLISIYENEAKLNMYVKEAFEENIGLEQVESIARSVKLVGYPGMSYSVNNAVTVGKCKSKIAKDILKEIGQNVKNSIGLKIKKDIQELLDTTAFDVVEFDVLKHPDSQYVLVNIFLWVFDAFLDTLLMVFSLVATFFKPQDINSHTWRDNIAKVTQESLNDHRSEIVRKLDEQCQSICRTLAKTLKQELQETQNHSLPIIPNSTKGYSGCKLTAASYGKYESGKKVIGLRADNFDHIHLSYEKGMDIFFDQRTVKESTTEMQRVRDFLHKDCQPVDNILIGFERRQNLNQIVRQYTQELMRTHSNLITISTSPVMSHGGSIEGKPCIVIYCSCKGIIPLGEPNFPLELDNIPVDVREGYIYMYVGTARAFHDPLRIGCSIGVSGESRAGSIGVFVKEIDTAEQYGLLTCGHVLLSQELHMHATSIRQKARRASIDFVQPSYMDDRRNRTCGKLIDAQFGNVKYKGKETGVDYAYVRMTSRIPRVLKFPSVEWEHKEASVRDDYTEEMEMGPPILDMDANATEQIVYKFGRTSGWTRGVINYNAAVMRTNTLSAPLYQGEKDRDLYNLYNIASVGRAFFEEGDSGASVFIRKEHKTKVHVIGLAVGAFCDGSECFVTPIGAVLDSINPRIEI